MLRLKSMEVKLLTQTAIKISWVFHPTPEPLANYTMQVYGGFSPAEVTPVSPALVGALEYIHILEMPREDYQQFFYEMQWFETANPARVEVSERLYPEPPADPITMALADKEELKIRLTGRRCALHIRRTEGKRCAYCWDEVRGAALDKHCRHCKGTGYWEGFHEPVYRYINIHFDVHRFADAGQGGLGEAISAVVELPSYPRLTFRDIIVEEHTGNAWRIVDQQGSKFLKLRTPYKQVWGVVECDKNIIERDTLTYE